MPKLKTSKTAAKRFKKTASGRFKHRSSNRSHLLTKRAKKRKLHLRGTRLVHESDNKNVKEMVNQW
jgi:large subunit ribosomal protein L35